MAEPAADLKSVAFPTLSEREIASLAECSKARVLTFKAGETLFRVGDRATPIFVVRRGEVEIRDELGDQPKVIVVHREGNFTGELSQLIGRPTVATGVARTDCEVLAIDVDALRAVLNQCPDVGDLILQAFIARRQLLREPGTFTGLRVVGSHSSQDTFRVRDFLNRNGQPFTWLDLDTDPTAKDLLRLFGLDEADTPVVSCGRHVVLKNPKPRDLAEVLGLRRMPGPKVQDVVVVGAGPAGLAAAV